MERLDPKSAVVVVVDIQEKLLPAVFEHDRVLRNAVLLLRLARVLDLPVVLTTQYEKGLGRTVREVLEATDATPLDKTTFGCFGNPAFASRLEGLLGRRQLVVAGIESHICVAQTVLSALERGFAVHVASDAVSSRTEANSRIGLARMERAGALLSSAEMAIYELLGRSDSASFKAMLPHLKGG